jgi:hypothetical protein
MASNFEAAVDRFKRDKVLIGLGLAAILILGVGAFFTQDDDKKAPAAPQVATTPVAAPVVQPALDPPLAVDFVKWWMTNAMDYRAQTAKASHAEAMRWMTSDAARTFQSNYWSPEIERGILSGQVTAAFQPVSVQPEAVNPDGTVVVAATGTLILQANGTPLSQQVAADFLVKRDGQGLRIAGLYNRQVTATAQTTAASQF